MNDNQQTDLKNETIEETLETENTASKSEVVKEDIPSMDEFEDQINKSFKKVNYGDILTGTIVGISDTEITLDLGSYAEGIVKINEISNDPNFSIEDELATGDEITAKVIKEDDGEGNILLSKKQADFLIAWDKMQEYMDNETVVTVKITNAVKGGVITPIEGIRGFIPASQLSVSYVKDLEEWVGKEVDAVVITVDQSKNRLVLSSKQVEMERRDEVKEEKLDNLEVGSIVTGVVDNIVPYGAFIKLDGVLSGLCHISQLSNKFVKSPNEVVEIGQEVQVKILDIKDGKINLSMKALEERPSSDKPSYQRNTNKGKKKSNFKNQNTSHDFTSDQDATTNLGDLLKDLDL